jgi:hypothetical protein
MVSANGSVRCELVYERSRPRKEVKMSSILTHRFTTAERQRMRIARVVSSKERSNENHPT